MTVTGLLSDRDNEVEIDRVNGFHDALNGYAPLLFDLNSQSTPEQLMECVTKFFDVDTEFLAIKLTESAKQQAWLQNTIELKGSIGKSALNTAALINETGVYEIRRRYKGDSTDEEVTVRHKDVIVLMYNEQLDGSCQGNKELDLDELRELLSRLMLIGRKGESKNQSCDRTGGQSKKDNVALTFASTFQNVERLVDSYVQLYNTGCSLFMTVSIRVTNSTAQNESVKAIRFTFKDTYAPLEVTSRDPNRELSALCSVFETLRAKWNEYVFETRRSHPIMNEFDMQQLNHLCSGLAQLRSNEDHDLDEVSLYYLQLLSPDITQAQIVEIVEKALEEKEEPTEQSNMINEILQPCRDERSQIEETVQDLLPFCDDNQQMAKAAIEYARKGKRVESADEIFTDACEWIGTEGQSCEPDEVRHRASQLDSYLHDVDRREVEITVAGEDSDRLQSDFSEKIASVFESYINEWKGKQLERLNNILSLSQLSNILMKIREISDVDRITFEPKFPFRLGEPNLVMCESRSQVLMNVLSLFMDIGNEKLPRLSNVLLCNKNTDAEELELFMLRSVFDTRKEIYAVAFGEKLSPRVIEHLEKLLMEFLKDRNLEYRLVFFNYKPSSQLTGVLEKFKRQRACRPTKDIREWVCSKLKRTDDAASIDGYSCRLVLSSQPASGLNNIC